MNRTDQEWEKENAAHSGTDDFYARFSIFPGKETDSNFWKPKKPVQWDRLMESPPKSPQNKVNLPPSRTMSSPLRSLQESGSANHSGKTQKPSRPPVPTQPQPRPRQVQKPVPRSPRGAPSTMEGRVRALEEDNARLYKAVSILQKEVKRLTLEVQALR